MLRGVQCLRAIAALLVVFMHAVECQQKYGRGSLPGLASIDTGFGVDIFFVVSGLIMVLITNEGSTGAASAAAFLRKRLVRVLPPYWFYTTLVVVGAAVVPQAFDRFRLDAAHVLQSYLLLPATNSLGHVLPVLIVGWTLCYEMYFYVIFAVLLLLPARRRLPALTLLFSGFALIGLVHRPQAPMLQLMTSPLLLEFLLGAWVGRWSLRGLRLSRVSGAALTAAGFAVMMGIGGSAGGDEWARVVCIGVPSAAVVAGVLALERSGFRRFPRVLVRMGDTSYSLYLSHILVLPAVGKLWRALGADAAVPDAVLLMLLVTASLAAAEVSYRIVEQPWRRLFGWPHTAGRGKSAARHVLQPA